VEETTKI